MVRKSIGVLALVAGMLATLGCSAPDAPEPVASESQAYEKCNDALLCECIGDVCEGKKLPNDAYQQCVDGCYKLAKCKKDGDEAAFEMPLAD
jgi:hypothetical protein